MPQPQTYTLIERPPEWYLSHNQTEHGPFPSLNAVLKTIRRLHKNHHTEAPAIPNCYFMFTTASALFRAAKDSFKRTQIPELDAPLPDTFESDMRIGPILLPLATETALKAYYVLEHKKPPPWTHDLLQLYNYLTPDTQHHLELQLPLLPETDFDRYPIPPTYLTLRDILSNHKNDFVTFRYPDQHGPLQFTLNDLEEATKILLTSFMTIFYKNDDTP